MTDTPHPPTPAEVLAIVDIVETCVRSVHRTGARGERHEFALQSLGEVVAKHRSILLTAASSWAASQGELEALRGQLREAAAAHHRREHGSCVYEQRCCRTLRKLAASHPEAEGETHD